MLRLTTFGGLAITKDGVPLTGAGAQRSRLALLALLAVAGPTGVSRDKLLLYLWPESDGERARHALKQAVYSLRRELSGDDEVILGTAALSLNFDLISSDVRDFETALSAGDIAAAVSLYAGPFLDGVHLKDSVEFDRWSAEQRARLAHLWTTAVERLATECEARGAWREAAGHWRTLAAAEPLSGRLAEALIRALAESGDLNAALAQYRIHEALLRDEMDTAPEAGVSALVDSLKAGTWRRSPGVPARATPPVATTETANAPVAPPATVTEKRQEPILGPVRPGRFRWVGYVVVALSFIAGASGFWYGRLDSDDKATLSTLISRGRPTLTPRLIVVAPLANKTNDRALDMFGEQAADWLMRELSESNFKVVDARTTRINRAVIRQIPRVFRSGDDDIALAEEAAAAYVVSGNYYKDGDSLEVNLSVVDVATRQRIKSFGPYKGTPHAPDALLRAIVPPTLLYLRKSVDTSAGSAVTGQTSPPSFEAFERLSRAWEQFFVQPRDTARVFAELDTAVRLDTTYAAPLLMKGYILDVKEQWPAVSRIVKAVTPLAPGMSRLERATLRLLEADLRGDPSERLSTSLALREMSPGSSEVPLLVVVSSMYFGRPSEAVAALRGTDPNRGMNLRAPAYWEWRSAAQHAAGLFADEAYSATEGATRYRHASVTTYAMVRAMATKNDRDLDEYIAKGIPLSRNLDDGARDPVADGQELMLYAARELRAHGFVAHADSLARRLVDAVESIPMNAERSALLRKANALYEAKRYAPAREIFIALASSDTLDIDAEGRAGAAAARVGDVATSRRIDAHLAAMRRPFMAGRPLRWRETIAAVEGRTDEALALLESAVRGGYRLFDTPVKLTVHLDADLLDLQRSAGYKTMLASLASEVVR